MLLKLPIMLWSNAPTYFLLAMLKLCSINQHYAPRNNPADFNTPSVSYFIITSLNLFMSIRLVFLHTSTAAMMYRELFSHKIF